MYSNDIAKRGASPAKGGDGRTRAEKLRRRHRRRSKAKKAARAAIEKSMRDTKSSGAHKKWAEAQAALPKPPPIKEAGTLTGRLPSSGRVQASKPNPTPRMGVGK